MKIIPSIFLFLLITSCVTPPTAPDVSQKTFSVDEIAAHIPEQVKNRKEWADDVMQSIEATEKPPTPERVCAVLAIIEQESGYQENPPVANLPKLVREGLVKKLHPLGIMAEPALHLLLAGSPPGTKETFATRIDHLRTERDLDRFFRDMASAYREGLPGPYLVVSAISKLMGKGYLQDLNPVTTAGSMQVKVAFARELKENDGKSDTDVREWLYTRAGGVRAGTHRLLGYTASYDDILYRFADYNSGIYSSRNAAFQEILTALTKEPLILDGDLQAYDDNGVKDGETKSLHAILTFGRARDKWEWTMNRDVKKEKTQAFEDTTLWEDVRKAFEEAKGVKPPYARMPQGDIAFAEIIAGSFDGVVCGESERALPALPGALLSEDCARFRAGSSACLSAALAF